MQSKILMIALGLATAGAMVAQTAQGPAPQTAQQPRAVRNNLRQQAGDWQDRAVQRLTARLNLTQDQQTQLRAILKESREQNKAMAPQIRAERNALVNAVKSDSLGQIDQITKQNVDMNTRIAANHIKTVARIYAILTPEQKAKFDARLDRFMNLRQRGV